MIYKVFKNEIIKVEVSRQKNNVKNGYEYYICVLTKGVFGGWNINEIYKQKTEINSEKIAFKLAKDLLNNNF